VRSLLVFFLLMWMKLLSRIFYRHDMRFIGEVPADPWENIKLVVMLNHTSLFEPIFLGGPVPPRFLWRVARHGVVPAADKTINRPMVGALFRFVAQKVVSISRERDHTWYQVLQKIDPQSMVIILPEGRMMRANGLDAEGNPMTVRGGIADILEAIPGGRMLIAYSGGLHHVQVPGHAPRAFKKIRMRLQVLEIDDYREMIRTRPEAEPFKRAVIRDMEWRRNEYCPTAERLRYQKAQNVR
jgi:1-acyl-sn-glycerol-3-phosphate acyltransferase